MKLSCLQQDLIQAIQIVQKGASGKVNSPIYQHIYIETGKDSLRLVTTNQAQTIATTIQAQIEEEGKILLPVSLFRDIVSKMPSVMIELKSNDRNIVTVSYINMKYAIQGTPVGEYTFIDDIDKEQEFDIETEKLKTFIKQTYFTVSLDESKPALNGILLKCENGNLDVVSSDSYRMSLVKAKLDTDISFEIIIPSKIIYDIISSADETVKTTHISFNKRFIKITVGDTMIVTGLIMGSFINYSKIIPEEYKTRIVCNRSTLLSILERAFILSDKGSMYPVKFEINFNKLFVTANSEAGEAFEEIQVQTEGDPLTIGFNSKFFIEILRNAEDENLTFEFTTNTRVCVIRPENNSDVTYVILPRRL